MEGAFLAVWCFVVAFAGGLVGLVLGNIRLPGRRARVDVSGGGRRSEHRHLGRSGRDRLGRSHPRGPGQLAPVRVDGAALGRGRASRRRSSRARCRRTSLLVVIGVTLLCFGVDLLRTKHATLSGPKRELDVRAAVVSGVLIGLLGGLVGLILGALRLPALLRYVGETPARAVGTNMTVGVCVGIAGACRSPRFRCGLDGVLDRSGGICPRCAPRCAADGSSGAGPAHARDRGRAAHCWSVDARTGVRLAFGDGFHTFDAVLLRSCDCFAPDPAGAAATVAPWASSMT